MDWAFKDRLKQDIEETTKDLQRLYNLRYKTNGDYTRIDYLERLLVDMEKHLRKAKS